MSARRLLLLAAIALVALAGCLGELPTSIGDLPYADQETVAERVTRSNELAFKLYDHLGGTGDNLVISPHSVAECAAMAYGGAQGETKEQMAAALCFWMPQTGFHMAMKALNDTLASRSSGQGPDAFCLSIVNGCWGRNGWLVRTDYLNLLQICYGAPLQRMNFAGAPDSCRGAINAWVADRTGGRVQGLFPPGSFGPDTYLVLANALWMKGTWVHQFDPEYTGNYGFTLLDGTVVSVPTMSGEEVFPYHEFPGFSALEMPYVGDQVSMLLILPDAGRFAEVEAELDARRLDEIVDALTARYVILEVPRFSIESSFRLIPTLTSLGMVDAFAPGVANFTGMDGVDDGAPWIDGAEHKTFLSVDEHGTEAAAGTGMWLTVGEHPIFDAHRPFLFVIRDRPTGLILFVGRVLDPRV